ncbi:MAG: hypothetical protein ACOZQL_38295 [Myxococcota bacterium]
MDFVGILQQRLQLPENAARGLAGQLLGLIEDTVRDRVSFGLAAQLRGAVPEMEEWQRAAPTLRPGALSLADLEPLPRGLGDQAELHGLLQRFQVHARESKLVHELALSFLATRLLPSQLALVARALPEH